MYLLGMLALSLLFRYVVHVGGLAASATFLLLPLLLLWPAKRFGIARAATAIGWTLPHAAPRPLPMIDPRYFPPQFPPPRPTPGFLRAIREIGWGLLGYLGGLPILTLGMITTLTLSRLVHAEPVHPIIEAAGRGPKITLQLYLLACGVAPMVEETFFRGALHHYLRGRHGFIVTALLTSFLFAAVHPQGWTTIPLLASIGIVLSLLREWRLTLLAPMTAHALNNFTAATFLVLALS
jgi:membrane protease YdiL (CAAX protease family)